MDLGTVLTATIMLAVCVLPFVLMNQKKQKRIKLLTQNFIEFAKENGQAIGEMETCGKVAIGLNTDSTSIFFVKENTIEIQKVNIEIKNIANISLEKLHLNESSNFEKIGLNIQIKGKASKLVELVLFDSNDKMQLDGELQLAEKWLKKLQEVLKVQIAMVA